MYLSLQALCPVRTSINVNSSHAKMVAYVRATMEDSDAFAPNGAKMGTYMGVRLAQLHFQAVMTTSVGMEEYVLLYF